MIRALFVSVTKDVWSILESTFSEKHIETHRAESGSQALSLINNHPFDIVVSDETLPDMSGLEFAKKLIAKNPMLNIALVSGLSAKDFHEVSEGLGILMQLPVLPQKSDAEKLLERLNHILMITKKMN